MAFDNNLYCDFSQSAAKAVAGKDILLCVFDSTGENLLAIAGQQSLTINRSADTIEVSSKDTEGGWKATMAGMKEWSIENGGLYVADDESHHVLSEAFENSDPVCVKVVNTKAEEDMFGGIAYITDYPIEAPYEDAVTYSITLSGVGKLTDLSGIEVSYTAVSDTTGKNPHAEGWYTRHGSAGNYTYWLTDDETPASGTTYYEKTIA